MAYFLLCLATTTSVTEPGLETGKHRPFQNNAPVPNSLSASSNPEVQLFLQHNFFRLLGTPFWNRDDGYAQFTLERESASSTKVRLLIANQCRRDTHPTAYTPNISASSPTSIIIYCTTTPKAT